MSLPRGGSVPFQGRPKRSSLPQTSKSPPQSGVTGTGDLVASNGPTLTNPVLGVATATSINKVVITAPATTATLTIVNNKVLTVNNSITLAGTDSTVMTFPSTSASLARTDAGNTFTGHQTIEGVTSTGATGTGKLVFDGTPTLVTPVIGAATGTSLVLSGNAQAASFHTTSGQTASTASGTPVTLGAVTAGLYLVNTYLTNVGSGNYTAVAIIVSEGTDARIALNSNGSLLTITLSTLNIQATQTSGSSQVISYSITKLV